MPSTDYLSQVAFFGGNTSTDALDWARSHRGDIQSALVQRGAVLMRGFRAERPTIADEVLQVLSDELLEDAFWSTPRSGVANKTFTATEYPKDRTIALHSEMAYMAKWPRLLAFHSLIAAEQGGETTISSLEKVSRALGDIISPFVEHGVMYRRAYHPGVDIPWQKAFRTDDKEQVEQFARRSGMATHWIDEDTLQTVHRAQGCIASEDGTPLWFNQAHVFHISNLAEAAQQSLLALFGKDQLPRHSLYGNGEEIPAGTIQRVHQVLSDCEIGVSWQPGDVLLLDNMRFLHGRAPFSGARKLHVAMATAQADPHRTPLFG